MVMHFERGSLYRVVVLFIVLWAALSIVGGTLNKVDAELVSESSSQHSAMELGLKLCAVIFTAVATMASGALRRIFLLFLACDFGGSDRPVKRLRDRYRPPPHGFSLLKSLQIIIV